MIKTWWKNYYYYIRTVLAHIVVIFGCDMHDACNVREFLFYFYHYYYGADIVINIYRVAPYTIKLIYNSISI